MPKTDYSKEWAQFPARKPKIEKVVLNIGVGSSGEKMEAALKLLKMLTNQKPVQTYSKHKIPAWGLRKGLPIGCKVTLRGKKAEEFLARAIKAVDSELKVRSFDNAGNVSFGIEQYLFFEDVKYDPKIGTMGLQVSAALKRMGDKKQMKKQKKTPKKQKINQDEAIDFIEDKFKIKVIKDE